jgi:hypothetical protein
MDNTDTGISRRFRVRSAVRPVSRLSVGEDMTAQLIPFKPVMKKQLEKRGFNAKLLNMKNLVPLYYNEFVSNKHNKKSPYIPINTFEFSNNPVFSFSESDNLNGDIFDYHNRSYFEQVAGVTDSIIDLFRTAKLKKRALTIHGVSHFETGESLTDEEKVQAKAAEKVEKNLENKLQDNKSITVKNIKTFVFFGLLVLLLFYLAE